MQGKKFKTVDEYIADLPPVQKKAAKELRIVIKKIAPGAEEVISYNIPTFKHNGLLVHYAAYNNHIGFYPGAGAVAAFKDELSAYETAKGTIRFPLDKALPVSLIKQIVKYRVLMNSESESIKTKKRKRN